MLGHLATDEPRAPTVVIELKAEKRANYPMRSDVYRDGVPIGSARGLSFLGPIVKGSDLASRSQRARFSFYIHAGVVGNGTNCVLLPAAAGSGKSSLTMALVHRGFQYFSDEVALVEPETFHVPPMPLAMAIKEPGWELAARYYPALKSLPVHVRSNSKVHTLPSAAWKCSGASTFSRASYHFPTLTKRERRPNLCRFLGQRRWDGSWISAWAYGDG